jgi:hypothetical protein
MVAPARAPPGVMLVPSGSFAVEARWLNVLEPRLVLGEGGRRSCASRQACSSASSSNSAVR